ncbi:response regulator [Sphingorhabdus sp. Alg239-R122]|uniref:response regulator n=1 Tax=Sphingorhabdus sp. Alg239-R122 TaxID=2305989 RepID=UPI0013DB25C5|nr:response regulator [Sphingorhabdus sp. Alg239-R122]
MAGNIMRILIVEDEPMIAMLLEDTLDMLGHEVIGTAESVEAAIALIDADAIDAAIVDINLNGEKVWPVAAALKSASVPFAISSGAVDSEIPEQHASAPLLKKPYMIADIETVLEELSAAS